MKKLLLAPVLWASLTIPALADQLSLGQISDYLNSFTNAQSPFTQINADGTISTGTLYIKRPGKVRFEYNPPDAALVLAQAGAVAIFDTKLGGQPDTYPLSRTPLSIILAKTINLGQADMVTGVASDGTTTTVTAQDPENREYGSIDLIFTADPTELRQWVVKDDTGGATTVILGALETGGDLPNRLFDIEAQKLK
ncbi:LolA family protein [Pseudoprimorskyibacter insulae]|uniref:Outer-membrane lipoprotein carrier protein n=1 Tax=Pseudoprimorskyibacter insulae TaxID=1695997 RepID=A0A2R8AV48_9RHOB|nr:outer membrane lipoprotein carrier protein LolA [Pseudoprimorskyibacter insulae]SPF79880.1 Outer-membrane lipoprotein carrier protein [Pseudoprimorskyibacter insulae]